jgi:hypothetical protein
MDKYEPIRASEYMNRQTTNPWPTLRPGEVVEHKLTKEKFLVYENIPHTSNDPSYENVGQKYVAQRKDGSKTTFFACAVTKV